MKWFLGISCLSLFSFTAIADQNYIYKGCLTNNSNEIVYFTVSSVWRDITEASSPKIKLAGPNKTACGTVIVKTPSSHIMVSIFKNNSDTQPISTTTKDYRAIGQDFQYP